jgi:hypothetical protein
LETLAQRVEPIVEAPTIASDEIKGEKSPDTQVHETTEKPLEMGEYIKEMWELGEASTHFEMPQLLSEINEFVLAEIERNKLESNQKSYTEIVKEYEKRLNLPDGIDVYTRAEKVQELMMIDKKLLDAAKAKEELLAKPISELTSSQLRKRIEGK